MRKLRHSDAAYQTDVARSAREYLMLTTPTAYHTNMSWIHQKRHELKESSKETDHCSFCRKGSPKVSKLLTGPNGIHICNECLKICDDVLKQYEKHPPPKKGEEPAIDREILRCSFCLRSEDELRSLIAGPTVYICGDCSVRLLREG